MEIFLNIIYYIVPFIVLLGVLVFVHEFGHFIIARSLGVGVTDFSIGFGKELWNHTDKYGTKWKVCAIPLGGYCQFLGDADASSSTSDNASVANLSEDDKKRAFQNQKNWKKLAIVIAGPAFNYIFAILVFIGIFYSVGKIIYPAVVGGVIQGEAADMAGIKAGDVIKSINGHETPDFQTISNEVSLSSEDDVNIVIERPLTIKVSAQEIEIPFIKGQNRKEKILGLTSEPVEKDEKTGEILPAPAVVGNVITGSAADEAGFQKGDWLDSINGIKLNDFTQLKEYVSSHIDDEFEVKLRRPVNVMATLKDTDFTDENGKKIKRRMLGIMSVSGIEFAGKKMGFAQAVKEGFGEAYDITQATLRAVGQMIMGQRGGKDVGGIIRIAEMSGDVSKSGGFIGFIYFMALLSVNLGLINLLPIPVLDGGHVLIFLCEMVTRRELSLRVKDYIFKFGLLVILAIMVLATWNDVVHLINRWFD